MGTCFAALGFADYLDSSDIDRAINSYVSKVNYSIGTNRLKKYQSKQDKVGPNVNGNYQLMWVASVSYS